MPRSDGCLDSRANAGFLLKADLDAPDEELRALRIDPPFDRPPESMILGDALEAALHVQVATPVQEWMRGTFHWVARGQLADGRTIATRILRLDLPALRQSLAVGAEVGQAARHGGVPAPTSLAVVAGGDYLRAPFAVSEWLEGEPLSRQDHDEGFVATTLSTLGALLGRLHRSSGSGAGAILPLAASVPSKGTLVGEHRSWSEFLSSRLEAHLARCLALGALNRQDLQVATAALAPGAWMEDGPVDRLLHGDAGPANVLVDDQHKLTGLLDWEDALVGDPIFELASCAGFHPERRWPSLFEGYFGRGEMPSDLSSRFWRYFLRIAIARTVARARFGVSDLPGRAPAAGRIQRALAALDGRAVR